MKRDEILSAIRDNLDVIRDRFDVGSIALFGSVARGDSGPVSDVDILVRFRGPATLRRFMGLQFFLEELTGLGVDLVTEKALRPELRPRIEGEALRVA